MNVNSGVPSRAKTLQKAERHHILQALRETAWVIAGLEGAATLLGANAQRCSIKCAGAAFPVLN
jgi:transcriptional regulator with GAF, ATPase, and Fis domain